MPWHQFGFGNAKSEKETMRIVLHDYGGYAFSTQLGQALGMRGHDVRYLHAAGFRAPRASLEGAEEQGPGFRVHGIDPGRSYRSRAGIRRLRHERAYGRLLGDAIRRVNPDAVISANCPLDAQAVALEASHQSTAAFVFWLQDLYALAVGRLLRRRLGPVGPLIGARFQRLERRLLRKSDAVIAITADFAPVLDAWGVEPDRVAVIENWAPVEDLPDDAQAEAWASSHGLGDRPLLLYAGTLGRKHDPTLLLDLARGVPQATIGVVAEGAGTAELSQRPMPENLRLLPLQAARDVSTMLRAADILVAVLDREAHAFSVPSKVLTYLVAGRPILAAMPKDNLGARTVRAAGAGVVVSPGDRTGLVQGAAAMLGDEPKRRAYGRCGREYAERVFDIDRIADRFEGVLQRVVHADHSRLEPRPDTA